MLGKEPGRGYVCPGMSTSKWLLGALTVSLAGMVLVYFGVGQLLAREWSAENVRTIAAPPAAVAAVLGDFHTWEHWSSLGARMPESLGTETKATFAGAPGTVGHAIVWQGSRGMATLRLAEVAPDHLVCEFASQDAQETEVRVRGRTDLSWRAEGSGTRVVWHDAGTWPDLAGRWFGWFGALQEHVKQIQRVSLDGLQEHFVGTKPK